MTPQAEVAHRDTTVEDAAAKMAALDIGALNQLPNAGALMVIEGTGHRGRPEPRVLL